MILLWEQNYRCELDDRNEKLGYKMRENVMRKIPYAIIIGQKELENNNISYRRCGTEETITVSFEEFINIINQDIETRGKSLL